MPKVITLRYAAKCKVCQKEIPAGNRASWYGKKQGTAHIECENPAPKTGDMPTHTVLKYADLRQEFLASHDGKSAHEILTRKANIQYQNELAESRQAPGNWTGASTTETLNWLQNGYMVPGLDGVDSTLIPGAPKRKLRFAEEGDEMLIDLAWSGVDEHFITWDKRNTKPSLQVQVSCSFSAMIPSRIVNSYQSWVARMLQTIDSFGLDMQVDLVSPGLGQMGGYENKHTVVIRVKESGEANDFSNWSPMFSPAGFRHLTFNGIIKCADMAGKDASRGLGRPTDCKEWSVKYDNATNVLSVTNNNNATDFPEFAMTQSLIAILAEIHG